MTKYKKILWKLAAGLALFLVSFLLLIGAARMPLAADWYSEHIYDFLVNIIGRIFGIFPFSVVEFGLYGFLVLVIVTFIRAIVKGIMDKKTGSCLLSWFAGCFLTASVLMALYVVTCGINYQRISFSEKEGFDGEGYTEEELYNVCRILTEEVNNRSLQISRDEEGLMELTGETGNMAREAMEHLGEIYSSLRGYYPRPKALVLSELLSWQGLSGIYSPFTIEANYNGDMVPYNIPFTMCHELSHLRGFMQEEEANFIAFLSCILSDSAEFQYSGYLTGWIYGMNELYRLDRDSWSQLRSLLSEEANSDLEANSEFWDRYEGKVSELSDKVNDAYLKANGQPQGIQSYNRMEDLVVDYYRGEE